jgi:hypothetical protein
MTNFLFSLFFLLQANPTGTVTGVVRNVRGMPAAGVRVYAMVVQESKDAGNAGMVLESISQTDESGVYRLEVPAGRYYIAAGSVDTPTYFPGTPSLAAARVISITSTAVVDGIDFSGFVPPAAGARRGAFGPFVSGPFVRGRAGPGMLSGVISDPTGRPVAGVFVSATPSNGASLIAGQGVRTDNAGRYRITGLVPATYYLAAGFSDMPAFYPGVMDINAATPITTTPTTNIDNLNFTLPDPPKATTVRGTIVSDGMPAAGAVVQFRVNPAGPVFALLPARPFLNAISRPDGSFEFTPVFPGKYALEARFGGVRSFVQVTVRGDQPVVDVQVFMPPR